MPPAHVKPYVKRLKNDATDAEAICEARNLVGDLMGDTSYDRRRLIFPGLAGLYEAFSPYSCSLMRFAAGALLVPRGIQKIMNGSWTTLAPYIEKQLGVPYPFGVG